MAKTGKSKLSSSLLAVQKRAQEDSRQQGREVEEKRAKRRARRMPVVGSVAALAVVSLSVGSAAGALLGNRIVTVDMAMDGVGVMILLCSISGILGALLAGFTIYQGSKAKRFSVQTPGVVSSARVVGRPGGSQTGSSVMYSVDAKVAYEVAGEQHSTNWYPGGSTNIYREGAERKYMGRVVTVSFEPGDPKISVVANPERAFKFARVLLGFCCIVFGTSCALLHSILS